MDFDLYPPKSAYESPHDGLKRPEELQSQFWLVHTWNALRI